MGTGSRELFQEGNSSALSFKITQRPATFLEVAPDPDHSIYKPDFTTLDHNDSKADEPDIELPQYL